MSEESTLELPAATTNHIQGISDMTTRSECEQQYEQERPVARRGGRRVGASELGDSALGVERRPRGPLRGG